MSIRTSCGCELGSLYQTIPYTTTEQEIDYVENKLVDVYVSGNGCLKCVMLLYFCNSLADICSTKIMLDKAKSDAERYSKIE